MNIVLTGASRGIGAALTRSFAVSGNHRIFIISRNGGRMNDLAEECRKMNPLTEIVPAEADITTGKGLDKVSSIINSSVSSVDILVNNAGLAIRKEFEKFSTREVAGIMETNFYAPAKLILQLLPLLIKSGNSHVVNISSMSGFQGSKKFAGMTYYGASKAALANLTETLAEEYKGRGVSFNCLAPGAVSTEMFAEVFAGYEAPVSAARMADFIREFAFNGHHLMNGRVVPVTLSDP